MKRRSPLIRNVLHSATPALASVVAAAAYGLGAIVFSVASGAEPSSLPDRALEYSAPSLYEHTSFSELPPSPGPTLLAAEPVETATAPQPVQVATRAPRIALVIDDLGLDRDAARRTAALPIDLTMAILPYADGARATAREAHRAGKDILVHMPMEPLGLADPGPHALQVSLEDSDLEARILWAMNRVPGAIGLNNHMGSRFTQNPRAMRVALSAISDLAPLFLDSMTTSESRGAAVARGLGLTALERDIFLDHVIEAEAIAARLDDAENLAELRGWAIVIGHPHDATLDALESWIGEAQDRGIEFVALSDLAEQLETNPVAHVEASNRSQ